MYAGNIILILTNNNMFDNLNDMENWLFDQYLDRYRDNIFNGHKVKNELYGLTSSWENRFVTPVKTLHFLDLCNN